MPGVRRGGSIFVGLSRCLWSCCLRGESAFAQHSHNTVLALCWLKQLPNSGKNKQPQSLGVDESRQAERAYWIRRSRENFNCG